jgi:hypothetical protein
MDLNGCWEQILLVLLKLESTHELVDFSYLPLGATEYSSTPVSKHLKSV